MKEVGDKFGAGELILPFVLQSAEVMKKAVAQLEKYLDKIEGYTKGTVVLATVFGDVHDIGKSLVNTILTNNGYTVIDLGKQVPIQTILDAAQRARSDRDRPLCAARLDLQADAGLHPGAARQEPALSGPDRRRGDQPRVQLPRAVSRRQGIRGALRAGRLLLQGRLRGPVGDGPVDRRRTPTRRCSRSCAPAPPRSAPRARRPSRSSTSPMTPCARSRAHDGPSPRLRAGVSKRSRSTWTRSTRTSTRTCCSSCTGAARASRARRGASSCDEDFRPRLERMWAEQDYLHPRALLGFFPCYAQGNDIVVLDPRVLDSSSGLDPADPQRADALRVPAPAQGRSHLPGRLLPARGRRRWRAFAQGTPPAELDVIAVQAVTVGSEVTELMAKLESDGEFAEQLFVHGLGVQTAEGLAEWLHWRRARCSAIPRHAGAALLVGLPRGARAGRAPEGRAAARPGADRHDDLRRLRPDPRAVDARAGRPPPAGDLLRHAPGPAAARRVTRRCDQGLLPRPFAVRRARRRGSAGGRGRSRGSAGDGRRER